MKTLLTTTALAVSLCVASVAFAQTVTTPSPTEDPPGSSSAVNPQDLAATVKLLTRAAQPLEVPKDQPAAIDLDLLSVPGINPDLVRGVTAKAYTRYVEVDGEKIGQVVLVGVARGGKSEPLQSEDFSAQVTLDKAAFDAGEQVEIEGDREALLAALERLNEETAADDQVEDQPQMVSEGSNRDGGAAASAPQQDGGQGYQSPSPVEVNEAAESVTLSSDGCPVRIDRNQMQAIQQTKTVTSQGGAVTSESTCTDGQPTFPLQKSYSVCQDKTNLEARTASAQFKLFYVDGGGARVEVSECEADPDKVFEIVEDETTCSISLDYQAGTATPQAALIYVNDANTRIEVRSCAPSVQRQPLKMVQVEDGCTLRHDFKAGVTHRQSQWQYEDGGVLYQAGGCRDDDTVFAHQTVYTDQTGNPVCQAIIDVQDRTVTRQSRKQITVDGIRQFVTDCQPDPNNAVLAIQATTEGCDNPATWEHDISAGQSYGNERFYYVLDGREYEVGGCRRSQVVYDHKVEITGYQNHDDKLFSYALTTVYIETPQGRHDVAVSQVLSGAVQQPYELSAVEERNTGETEYAGCDAIRLRQQVKVWARPDSTEYEQVVGPAAPSDPVNLCREEQTESRAVKIGHEYVNGGGYNCRQVERGSMWHTECQGTLVLRYDLMNTVTKTRKLNTETGQVVSETCKLAANPLASAWRAGVTNYRTTEIVPDPYVRKFLTHWQSWPPKVQTVNVPPCPF